MGSVWYSMVYCTTGDFIYVLGADPLGGSLNNGFRCLPWKQTTISAEYATKYGAYGLFRVLISA